MNVVIVDDELLARQVLEEYITKISQYNLVLSTGNPIEFVNYVRQHSVDLVFLDIEMPELNGMEILRSLLPASTKVILTTAYSEFALESYEFGVIDYLLKPIKLERFLKAIHKVSALPVEQQKNEPLMLTFKHDGFLETVAFDDIYFIQSFGNYLKIFTFKRMYLITETLSNIAKQLPNYFQQTHKSYIVNLHKVLQYDNNTLEMKNHNIPVSASYKILVKGKMDELK